MARLHELKPAPGSRKGPKRVGRGTGSGHGKTAGRGHKGQKSRAGGGKGPGFEGGQMPLQRKSPKRGFHNPFGQDFEEVNVGRLCRFAPGSEIAPGTLAEQKIIARPDSKVKILGSGDLDRPLIVRAHRFSAQAIQKIEAAGGKAEVIQG
ncbi:MAG: 50S ribosomal protein L15 [bacterium]|nr:50S ribosomal protein L15 [bacterium]